MYDLAETHRGWVEESIEKEGHARDGKWTESVAVGSESFVTALKEELGSKAMGREVIGGEGAYVLKEPSAPYVSNLERENAVLRPQNGYFWQDIR